MPIAKKILLVEDDKDDQHIFLEVLKEVSHDAQCVTVDNGREAISHLEIFTDYDLIFLDLNMPIMTGRECLYIIRESEKLRQIPIVVFTTSKDPSDVEYCKRLGIKSYWNKPNSLAELRDELKAILDSQKLIIE